MVRLAWLVLAMAAGCVETTTVPCANGTTCPAEYVCAASGGCLSPAQLAECEGLVDGDACTLNGQSGSCRDGGCVAASCGNDVVELDEVCDDGNTVSGDGCNGTCTSAELCGNGIAELAEECDCGDAQHPGAASCGMTFNGGTVCSETCVRRGCGNGAIDPGELCDDGNNMPGDDCSVDCLSDESCGNGIVDYFVGETCDDRGYFNRDGCSATCRSETLAWQTAPTIATPVARIGATLAYDARRARFVLFGGREQGTGGGGLLDDTWELDNRTWIRIPIALAPPLRLDHAMAYDAARGKMVLFGGEGVVPFSKLDDTWEFDGTTWVQRTPAVKPPPRTGHAMAYDAGRKRIVLFGGTVGLDHSDDTWEYDGTTWTQVMPAMKPSPRSGAAMVFDPARGKIVLHGGVGAALFGDTWTFDGMNWAPISTTLVPNTDNVGRRAPALAYDPVGNKIVMFGGVADQGAVSDDTWELSGTTWTRADIDGPGDRFEFTAGFDLKNGGVVIFGGTVTNDTWHWSTGAWTQRMTPLQTKPNGRSEYAMAADLGRGTIVLYGGASTTGMKEDTWIRTGDVWIEHSATSPPGVRLGAAMTYNTARRRITMFGGTDGGGTASSEVWEFDGSTWTLLSVTGTPPDPRIRSAIAYDSIRNRLVVFGGELDGFTQLDDTWELDTTVSPAVWQEKVTTNKPAGRSHHAMVQDVKNGGIVLFGGYNVLTDELADTWRYNGIDWTPITVTGGPVKRQGHGMAFDGNRGRVVMFGGRILSTYLDETWDWNGTTWTPVTLAVRPPGRANVDLAFDPASGDAVTFGGERITGLIEDTWTLSYTAVAAPEVCSSPVDTDGDGDARCDDSDCWGVCSPACPPGTATCPTTPRCGDGVCSGVEDCRTCSADCAVGVGKCTILCGDYFCDTPESLATCPGDCAP